MQKENKTGENWWPRPLAHVRDIDPWADTDVLVAEIRSFDDAPHTGHRHMFSALVPVNAALAIRKPLAKIVAQQKSPGIARAPLPAPKQKEGKHRRRQRRSGQGRKGAEKPPWEE